MTRIQFAQKAVITDGRKFLLVRKSCEDPYNPGKWEFPGGRMESAEGLDQHVRREVLEETGLQVEPGRIIDMWSWEMFWDGEQVRVIAVSRYCHLVHANASAPRRLSDDYIDAQAWYSRGELLDLDVIDSQRTTLKLVAED
ncbi:NUDIX domain-containing protein [Actinoallomurus purpureus]|uniref:NUDIX domain-containing protein n=1 Tax=Actinoallomurus purpureus TaxID=478114 RepID=UPI0020925D8C|nr:NUDIX domain-containing protein [Actinoallomurus purpureus]MCO6003391.1 NUDIX domain-containing protein [Actinoallomurus purpureus]